MSRKYFGTDGVRGLVGQMPIVPDFVMRLGNAAGRVLKSHAQGDQKPTVLIGKDTRVSGYMLEAALEAGFSAAGVDVVLAGPMPTAAVAYLTRAQRLSAGVVISASHNPYHDNGIKFFSAQGTKLPDTWELEIEALLDEPLACVASESLGKARRLDDAAGRYTEFCKSIFPNEFDLRGLKLAVDCANGAAYHIAQDVFHELGAEVYAIADQPDGFNINDHVGATHPETVQNAVIAQRCDIGFALDGDADRLIVVDRHGRIYNGDELLYILALHQHATRGLEGVVGTLMSNFGLEKALQGMGVSFERAKVGDRYVFEKLKEKGWHLGGESSGHILSLDKHSTGDGIVSALLVLSAMRHFGKDLPQMVAGLQMYPQILRNVRVGTGYAWDRDESLLSAKHSVDALLRGRGRTLIRPSGTEPLVRVMVEADDESLAHQSVQTLLDAMRVDAG